MPTKYIVLSGVLACCLFAAAPTFAETPTGRGTVFIPALMTGPGSFGPIGFRRLCDLRIAGLAEWRTRYIERVIKATDAQKTELTNLENVSAKAVETVTAACRRDRPQTAVAELELVERRLDALVQAFKAVKAAFEAFYASLDERQKAKIDVLGPHRQGWRW